MGPIRGAADVMRPTADEAITAANLVLQGARDRTVTHLPNEALDLSAATSTRRDIGRAGGWGFGGENSAPVEACAVVARALNVPADFVGATQYTQTAGSYSASMTVANPTADLYLTKGDRARLGLGRRCRVGSIEAEVRDADQG